MDFLLIGARRIPPSEGFGVLRTNGIHDFNPLVDGRLLSDVVRNANTDFRDFSPDSSLLFWSSGSVRNYGVFHWPFRVVDACHFDLACVFEAGSSDAATRVGRRSYE